MLALEQKQSILPVCKQKVPEIVVYEIFLKYYRMICEQQKRNPLIIPTFGIEFADVLDAFYNTPCDIRLRPKNHTD